MKKFLFIIPIIFLACSKTPHKTNLKCNIQGTEAPLWVCYQSFNQINAKQITNKPSPIIKQMLLAKGSIILSQLINTRVNYILTNHYKDLNKTKILEKTKTFVYANALPSKEFYDKDNKIYNVLISFDKKEFQKFLLKECNISKRDYLENF